MSKIRSVDAAFVDPTKTAERLPSPSSPTVTLFARVSPFGKFSVDDVGCVGADGPRKT
jgi:hypothetical protein